MPSLPSAGAPTDIEDSFAAVSRSGSTRSSPFAVGREYQIPIQRDTPSRQTPQQRRRRRRRVGTPSASSKASDEIPDLTAPKDNSFKSWLTSGMLDAFNVAAGLTLSTTGQIMAPPIHVTKTVLLPGLLALVVDTLDTVTPELVQDWFRIVSSSVYHVISVLRSTESGQDFSNQFLLVLQDLLQVWSAPEARQVLVDGMAGTVKLAEALQ